MKVSKVMVKNPIMVDPDTSCSKLAQIMRDNKIGSLIIEKDGKPVAIVTERDLVHRLLAEGIDPMTCTAAEIYSKPVVAVSIHADVDMAVDIMNDYKIRRIVVVDDKDKVVGILTTDDLARQLREMSEDLAIKYVTMTRS
jgi:CBS domain-containing protein